MKSAPKAHVDIIVLTVGSMQENCYVVTDTCTKESYIIDPGDEGNFIAEQIQKYGFIPKAILATHGHFDHIMGARELQLIYSIPFYIHKDDIFLVERMSETAEHFLQHAVSDPPPVINHNLSDKDVFKFGSSALFVIATPGHTPGSVCFMVKGGESLFVGDTLFADGGVGRTDFSYSDKRKLDKSIRSILKHSDTMALYPGHGEKTNIFKEKQYHATL